MFLLALPALASPPAPGGAVGGAGGGGSAFEVDPGLRPEEQIVFGGPEEGYPAAVSLGAGPYSACSGSMITPRIVLSAAHCSGGLPLEAVVEFGSVTFIPDRSQAEMDDYYWLESAVVHPDYVELDNSIGELGQFDLGVVVMEEEAPVQPVRFRMEPLGSGDEGTVLRSVGYGLDETGVGSDGVKRSADLTVSEIDAMYVISESQDNPNGATICSGDSGGPQYAVEDGRLVQWAVHSWGDIPCRSVSGSTRTDVGAEWILDQVELVHGTRDLCIANGNYDDGVCDRFCDFPDPDCLPVVFGVGEALGARTCSTTVNRFCVSGWMALGIALSRRRRGRPER